MAVTIIDRPQGHKIGTQYEANIVPGNSNYATVAPTSTVSVNVGDVVYIESNYDYLNGFKYVAFIGSNQFLLSETESGPFIVSKGESSAASFFLTTISHGWQCVHLPIVYTLNSNKYPINTVDPISTVGGVGNSNGYQLLNVEPIINIDVLDYVTIETDDGPIIVQVLEASDHTTYTRLVVNIPYQSHTFLSAQKYYNNYFITVQVWSGLESAHRWVAEKPFELATTLKFIPDSDGNVKFSISEILKGYINLRNNLTLDTLPNNIDFLTEFYIKINENYDSSDGTSITSFAGSVSDDSENFIGQAVNAKTPFKSINQGFLSDYIDSATEDARWLTTQDRPQAYVDRFFDLSFINTYAGSDVMITILKKLNGSILDTDTITYTNPGIGILRIPVTPESGFDEYCLQGTITGATVLQNSLFFNISGPGVNWLYQGGGTKKVTLDVISISDLLSKSFQFQIGVVYTVTVIVVLTGSAAGQLTLQINDKANAAQFSQVNALGSSPQTISITFTATANTKKIAIKASRTSSSGPTRTVTLNSATVSFTNLITEQICINIVDECQTFVDDNLRLTEDVRLRELE